MGIRLYLWVIATSMFPAVQAQCFVPGLSYFGTSNYIEYIAGNTAFIISVPHGGALEPAGIPDRDCLNCEYAKDTYTQELARELQQAFYQYTGCYPHVVINLLHRKKLDMNRDIVMATDSNAATEIYWHDYHRFIDSAKQEIQSKFGKGLFLELHGHAHPVQRIELGYLLTKTELQQSDSTLSSPQYVTFSSISSLANSNLQNSSQAQLLRGPEAFGTLLANMNFPSVPSAQDPYPLPADPYFNGGYNTFVHGSNTSGSIDAIQIELYSDIRYVSVLRKAFADSMVQVMLRYAGSHYFLNYESQPCGVAAWTEAGEPGSGILVYPNPVEEFLYISNVNDSEIRISDATGREVYKGKAGGPVYTGSLAPGAYYIKIEGKKNPAFRVFLKR